MLVVLSLLFFTSSVTANSPYESQQQAQEKLNKVQNQIKRQHTQISQQQTAQGKVEVAIKQTDIEIGKTSVALRKTRARLVHVKTQLNTLEKEKLKLESQKDAQLEVLSAQVRSAYQVGDHDYLMMLLNQESPGKLERVLTYYQYLNKARTAVVDDIKGTIEQLAILEIELNDQRIILADLLTEQLSQETELTSLKQKQKKSLAKLKTQLRSESKKLQRLKDSENSLTKAIDELTKAVQQLPDVGKLNGLGDYLGKLAWPVQGGKVRQLFGKRKRGPLSWKGNRIDSPTGTVVNTIHSGQVIYSDWMKGVGLVMVIDHGKGYMSLYGHNQALLKDVGDMVESGEPIALVGQSGGQNFPNLYFEIRYKGQPKNPQRWCRSF